MRSYRQGVTLLELLLVIAVVGVLFAVFSPIVTRGGAHELDESATRMRALISMCRAEAMNNSLRYRIEFRRDGTIRVLRQSDPVDAPHEYVEAAADWARQEVILGDVWVESLVLLPEGPPPILIDEDEIEFEQTEVETDPIPIEDFEKDVCVDFTPDGSSNSLRWVLRNAKGVGLRLTLDGRLGRVEVYAEPSIDASAAVRPPALDEEGT